VNRELVLENDSLMFVTCFCGILNLETGEFAYSNAGHLPPLLIRPGQEPRWLTLPPGLFLGIDENTVFGTEQITLEPGDMILTYSDGITEADDLQQRLYSGNRLMATVAEFAHGAPQSDDMTILAARLKHLKPRTPNS
jgi:sigma-B regulation protein RsbU (phosphoserine phosphatase)